MKTSNKIIVSFLTFAWLSFIATLLISHQFADYDNIPGMRRVVKKVNPLEDFSVVKIEDVDALKIVPGDSNQLNYDELSGADIDSSEAEPTQNYRVGNDTLFITSLRRGRYEGYILRVNNMKQLIVDYGIEIDLAGFIQDSLRISATESNVTISKNSEFSYLHLKSGQKFDLTFKSVKEFGMALSEANCNVFGDIGEISGIVGNYAGLGIPRNLENVDVNTSTNGKLHYMLK